MSVHYPNPIGRPSSPHRAKSERIADLSRYPGVTEAEAKEILTFIRTGRHLEVGLLTADETVRPPLDAFMEDHKTHLGVKWWEIMALLGGIIVVLLVFWLALKAFA